jgi:hypothetical protein
MTDIRKSDDIIDVRDIIARVEELEEARKPWRAGWNMPGYMPDSEPAGFATFEDARDYLIDELARVSDESFDMAPDIDDAKARCSRYDAAIESLQAQADEGEYGETVGNYHYWIAKVDGDDAFDDVDDAGEYQTLTALLDDLKGNGGDEQWRGDWYPITLINEAHFVEAMKELCADIGDIPRELPSYIEIDWEATAKNLKVDYAETEFDDVTFFYR